MNDDCESTSDEPDAEDPFDRRVSDLLDAEADRLRMYAEQLLMAGSISIDRAGGLLMARFRGPAWRNHGFLSWHRRRAAQHPGFGVLTCPDGWHG